MPTIPSRMTPILTLSFCCMASAVRAVVVTPVQPLVSVFSPMVIQAQSPLLATSMPMLPAFTVSALAPAPLLRVHAGPALAARPRVSVISAQAQEPATRAQRLGRTMTSMAAALGATNASEAVLGAAAHPGKRETSNGAIANRLWFGKDVPVEQRARLDDAIRSQGHKVARLLARRGFPKKELRTLSFHVSSIVEKSGQVSYPVRIYSTTLGGGHPVGKFVAVVDEHSNELTLEGSDLQAGPGGLIANRVRFGKDVETGHRELFDGAIRLHGGKLSARLLRWGFSKKELSTLRFHISFVGVQTGRVTYPVKIYSTKPGGGHVLRTFMAAVDTRTNALTFP